MMSMQVTGNANLALVGMHGPPEITGQALKESCDRYPIDGWDVEVANQRAIDAGVRYVAHNMAVQFRRRPPTVRTEANYELWRPAEVCDLVFEYEQAIEIHDGPNSAAAEYVAVGATYKESLLRMAAQLGIRSVVNQWDTPTLNNVAGHSLTVELGRGGNPQRRLAENVERLRECMRATVAGTLPKIHPADFTYYDFEGEILWEQAISMGLDRMGVLDPFEPIPPRIIELLGLSEDDEYVAEYWNGNSSAPGEWFGGILRRVLPRPNWSEISDLSPQ